MKNKCTVVCYHCRFGLDLGYFCWPISDNMINDMLGLMSCIPSKLLNKINQAIIHEICVPSLEESLTIIPEVIVHSFIGVYIRIFHNDNIKTKPTNFVIDLHIST